MAKRIHQLPRTLINKIAAGEVIVRPASCVKELIENSLDAGARRVRIEISNHCRDITIIDDGEGMESDDAVIALDRHSTSKISQYEDIETLLTRGFRGEALASIAAVARMEVITHHESELAGCRLKVEGGELLLQENIGAPVGTTIKVKDLFFNTPARLKFLGTPRTEMNHITRIFVRQALSAPNTGFVLVTDKKTYADLPPGQTLEERTTQLLGAGLADSLLPVKFDHPPVKVTGLIARPEVSRKDRTREYFFINKRPIRSRGLSASLEQAFKGYLMTRRFPIAVIFIDIDTEEVDVNVHPTKEEVRLTRQFLVTGVVHRAVTDALQNANLTRNVKMPGTEDIEGTRIDKKSEPSPDEQKPSSFFSQQMQMVRRRAEERREARQQHIQIKGDYRNHKEREDNHATATPLEPVDKSGTPPKDERAVEGAQLGKDDYETLTAVAQVADTYLVAISGDTLFLIDQHAAHERLLYEKLKSRHSEEKKMKQLMIPVSVEVGIGDMPLMGKLTELLQARGIEIEHFGGQTFIIRSLPADVAGTLDVAGMVFDLLDDVRSLDSSKELHELRDKILIRMACRAAIKSGQKLSREEQQRLLDDLLNEKVGFTCPHGRPTMIKLSRTELDKQFKRI